MNLPRFASVARCEHNSQRSMRALPSPPAHSPPGHSIQELYGFKSTANSGLLGLPVLASIACMQDSATISNGPAMRSIDKANVIEVGVTVKRIGPGDG